MGLYQFTDEDKSNLYFKDKLEAIKDYVQYDMHDDKDDELKTFQSGQYFKNIDTGDQYYFNLQIFKKKD